MQEILHVIHTDNKFATMACRVKQRIHNVIYTNFNFHDAFFYVNKKVMSNYLSFSKTCLWRCLRSETIYDDYNHLFINFQCFFIKEKGCLENGFWHGPLSAISPPFVPKLNRLGSNA
jgi:hypothetical protein